MPNLETLTTVSEASHLLAGDLVAIAFMLFLFAVTVGAIAGMPLWFAYVVGYEKGQTAAQESHKHAEQYREICNLKRKVRDLKSDGRCQNTVFLAREG